MSFGPYLVTSTVGSGGYDVYVGVPFGKTTTTVGNPTAGMGIEMVAWSGSTPPTTRIQDPFTGIYYSNATSGATKYMTFVGCVWLNANVVYDFYGARCVLNMYNRIS